MEHVKTEAEALAVERFDSEPVAETELMPLLLEAGFLAGRGARSSALAEGVAFRAKRLTGLAARC